MNRLASEPSPYLQQHAENPVDWYPWGPEALSRAKAEDKPILLSIGYSTCHWCHVMERESFKNPVIAASLNRAFVCIKVDREERPDLDHIYQTAAKVMGRSGGWPLTVFLTPDQHPFFVGTYFPCADRYEIPGLPRVLEMVLDRFRTKRAEVEHKAQGIVQAIDRAHLVEPRGAAPHALGRDVVAKACEKLSTRFDDRHGGFGDRPKFPNPMCLDLLLRCAMQDDDQDAKRRLLLALDGMRKGGLWDQLGGGFHRYSTDDRWLVPHFEKMLCDNALLLRLYCDAFRACKDERYAATASDIGTYLLSDMQDLRGGFYAAQDADSEGREGRFFVWTEQEVKSLLADDPLARDVALSHFGITTAGNFDDTGTTVLSDAVPLPLVAESLERLLRDVEDALTRATLRMLAAREKRVRPFRDEKILASWNGLAMGALADASLCLREPALLSAAEKAFDYVERMLVHAGRVERYVKDGVVKGPGLLDDHANVCAAALDLYEATGDEKKMLVARAIADEIIARFWDPADKAFAFTPNDGERLIACSRDPFDQATPSGASMAAWAFLKLGALVDEKYSELARQYVEPLAGAAIDNPFAFGHTLAALDRLVRGSTDVVILGARTDPTTKRLLHEAFAVYLPNRNIVLADPSVSESTQAVSLVTRDKRPAERAIAYVCANRSCSAPVESAEELGRLLAGSSPP